MKFLNRETSNSIEQEVTALGMHETTIVEFGAEWCGPCKVLLPVLKELSQKYMDKVAVATIDISENLELAKKYQVSNIPCLVVLKEGKEVDRVVGYAGRDSVEKLFIKHS